jgi:hypothetical protein
MQTRSTAANPSLTAMSAQIQLDSALFKIQMLETNVWMWKLSFFAIVAQVLALEALLIFVHHS